MRTTTQRKRRRALQVVVCYAVFASVDVAVGAVGVLVPDRRDVAGVASEVSHAARASDAGARRVVGGIRLAEVLALNSPEGGTSLAKPASASTKVSGFDLSASPTTTYGVVVVVVLVGLVGAYAIWRRREERRRERIANAVTTNRAPAMQSMFSGSVCCGSDPS
jgi:pilus assembly protein TadC